MFKFIKKLFGNPDLTYFKLALLIFLLKTWRYILVILLGLLLFLILKDYTV